MYIVKTGRYSRSVEEFKDRAKYLREIHKLGRFYLSNVHEHKQITTDMDGVISYDDSALLITEIVGGRRAKQLYYDYSEYNKRRSERGEVPYCFYSPGLFMSCLLEGIQTEVSRTVGRQMRLIPDSHRYFERLGELGYRVRVVTAAQQENAEEVCRKAGILDVTGTRFGIFNGAYDGRIESFLGGAHKREVVVEMLRGEKGFVGTHIGDSWSDIEALEGIPNSVAFNPGCELALRNALISVIGTSKMCLLPLFDYDGKYDYEVDLPHAVVLNDFACDPKILDFSKKIKKRVERYLPDFCIDDIVSELEKSGLVFRKNFEFMDPEDFDRFALKSYGEFLENQRSGLQPLRV